MINYQNSCPGMVINYALLDGIGFQGINDHVLNFYVQVVWFFTVQLVLWCLFSFTRVWRDTTFTISLRFDHTTFRTITCHFEIWFLVLLFTTDSEEVLLDNVVYTLQYQVSFSSYIWCQKLEWANINQSTEHPHQTFN